MYVNHYTLVDLWVKTDPLGEDFQASKKSKTFFMGSTFSFPQDREIIYKDILGVYKPDQKIWKTKSLCELREPSNLFSEDVTASPHMINLIHSCGKSLSDNGYESFHYCNSQKKPAASGSFFQRAHEFVKDKLGH